jgi:hypothetical protein
MCYSATSSFGTFLFVFSICALLWVKGSLVQKGIAIILLSISLMQVLEGLIWLNTECSNTNIIITSFIPLLLFIQPIVAIGTVYAFGIGDLSPLIYKTLLGIWLLSIPSFMYWMKDGLGKCTTIGDNGHLVWPFTNTNEYFFAEIVYNTLLIIAFISLKTKWYGFFYIFMSVLGFWKSRITYGHSWGSVWCHFVNILAIGALFI